jgi:hypothetical protein
MPSSRIPVFYSFHYDNDVFRVNLVRHIGQIEDNAPVSPNDWEQIKRTDAGIRKWIDDNMSHRRCVIVLVGSETANRKYVRYEIEKAWNDKRALFGINIHNLNCARTRTTCAAGVNPFSVIKMDSQRPMSDYVTCHDPSSYDAYNTIARNMEDWVDAAITQAKARWG